MMDLVNAYLNNSTSVECFVQNSSIIESTNNTDFLVIDLETGIVRDINTATGYCGCFGGCSANSAYNLGENLSTGNTYINLGKIAKFSFGILNFYVGGKMAIAGICGTPETAGGSLLLAAAGVGEMILGNHEVWSSASMPNTTDKNYGEQIQNWNSWFI
jgi:hypothetical protein